MGHPGEASVGVHRDVDDSATTILDHPSVGHRLSHVPCAGQVGRHYGVESIRRDELRRTEELTTAVVDQDVDAAQLVDNTAHKVIHGISVADVCGEADDLLAQLFGESSGGGFDALGLSGGDGDAGPEPCKLSGGGCANTGAAARDQGDATIEDAISEYLAVHGVIMPQWAHHGEATRRCSVLLWGMRLLVTGGSSFVGAHFCRRARGAHQIYAIHHTTPMAMGGVTPVKADLRLRRDRRRLAGLGVDAVVHLATKVKGKQAPDQNRQMMDAVLGLERPVVYASSTVVHWSTPTPYGDSRREDEARLVASGLPWATLRPSAPYGPVLPNHRPGHRESFHTLVDWIRRSPLVPVIGDGEYRRQPVHVEDFSDGILALLAEPLPNQAFDVGGADALSFNRIIDLIATALGRSGRRIHLPKSLVVQLANVHDNFDADLIRAVDEDELADSGPLSAQTGVQFRAFSDGLRCLL